MLVTGEMVRDEETGIWVPAYPEAFATVMRQSGKTLWILAAENQRAIMWEAWDAKPQAIAYSGQSGSMARQKFRKEHWPIIKHSPLNDAVHRPRFAAEDTGIDYVNGSILTIWSSSEDAGHSLTVDLVCMDEIWADADDRREQAAIPATATRHDHQKLLASTGGTDKSVFYLRKQAIGRASVNAGRTDGVAYLEFSFDRDDDPEDPRTWWANMPALGHTITERTVQAALDEMRGEDGDLAEFCRAWGNVTKRSGGDKVIPAELWIVVQDETARVTGRRAFAVSATFDRTHAAIAVADHQGHVTIADHRPNVGWLEERCVELHRKWGAPIAVDVGGPAGYLAERLEARKVPVKKYAAQSYGHACSALFDRLVDKKIHVFPHEGLDQAVDGVTKRPLGDLWAWSRKSPDVDISPLEALTLAVDAAAEEPPGSPRLVNLSEV